MVAPEAGREAYGQRGRIMRVSPRFSKRGRTMTGKGTPEPDSTDAPERLERQALDCIRNALRGLRFGQVTVVVQDGIVVQVERTERIRPPRAGGKRQ